MTPQDTTPKRTLCRPQSARSKPLRVGAVAMLVLASLALATPRAQAQVVARVTGNPTTAFEVDQRIRLRQVSVHKTPPRQEVIEELINEHLKVQLLKRYAIDGMDNEVNSAFNNMAGRLQLSPQQFTELLSKSGISVTTLKFKIRADITWTQIVRARYQSGLQIAEKDIMAKLVENKVEDTKAFDYTLRPILFVVPRGSADTLRAARVKEAEALRTRFTDCQSGVGLART